jgi:hypothetical protein
MRFDDTNPEAEKGEYIDNIIENLNWLGHKPSRVTYSSDYFQELYDLAVKLIRKGKAYVDHQTAEEIRKSRETKIPSPWRERPVEESIKLFEDMRKGKFAEGKATLRMKGDMNAANPQMWDLVAYRIKYCEHPRQYEIHSASTHFLRRLIDCCSSRFSTVVLLTDCGKKWCIYPSYDYTHWSVAGTRARNVRPICGRWSDCNSDPTACVSLSLLTASSTRSRTSRTHGQSTNSSSLAHFGCERYRVPFAHSRRVLSCSLLSSCTLEFEVRRESYYWLLHELDIYKPNVWEFSRLQLEYTVMSKRRLLRLVNDKLVTGWDDPRLSTLNGFRRRGYPAEAIKLSVNHADTSARAGACIWLFFFGCRLPFVLLPSRSLSASSRSGRLIPLRSRAAVSSRPYRDWRGRV